MKNISLRIYKQIDVIDQCVVIKDEVDDIEVDIGSKELMSFLG